LCGFKKLNMGLDIIFTWWNKQTFGTFLKTLFFGVYVGKDELGNKYYKNKRDERWVVYSSSIEATKIPPDWYLWMHYTIDKIPRVEDSKKKKYLWQKNHQENQTGSKNSYKPIKIRKNDIKKKYETWK
jgi:NADH dehydrogenase